MTQRGSRTRDVETRESAGLVEVNDNPNDLNGAAGLVAAPGMLAINPASGFMYYNQDGSPTGWEQFGTAAPIEGGEINTGANVGNAGGQSFRDKTGVTLNFRRIVGLDLLSAANNVDHIDVDFDLNRALLETTPADSDLLLMRRAADGVHVKIAKSDLISGAGENNTGVNLGAGVQVFESKSGVALQFRSIAEEAEDPITWAQGLLDVTATLDFSKPPATASVAPADMILIAKDGTLAVERATAGDFDVTTASNLGPGIGVFSGKVVADLQFKSLLEDINGPINLTDTIDSVDFTFDIERVPNLATPMQDTDLVLIQRPLSATAKTTVATLLAMSSVGTGAPVFDGRVAGVAEFHSLTTVAGEPVSWVERVDEVELVFDIGTLTQVLTVASDDKLIIERNDGSFAYINWTDVPAGGVTGGSNIGVGAGVFDTVNGTTMEFKTLDRDNANPVAIVERTTGIDITFELPPMPEVFTIVSTDELLVWRNDDSYARVNFANFPVPGISGGTNLGTGANVFSAVSGNDLEFRSLATLAANPMAVVERTTEVDISFDMTAVQQNPFVAQDDELLLLRNDGSYARALFSIVQPQGSVSGKNLGTGAALIGNYGLNVNMIGNSYVQKTLVDETRVRTRFYIDVNSIAMADNDQFIIHQLMMTNAIEAEIQIAWLDASGFRVRISVRNDAGTAINGAYINISDAVHWFEIDWQASSGPGLDDGFLTFWIDDAEQYTLSAVDNDESTINSTRIGVSRGWDATTTGDLFLDEFEVRRETFIGRVGDTTPNPITDFIFYDGFENGNLLLWEGQVGAGLTVTLSEGAAIFAGQSANVLAFRRLFSPGIAGETPLTLTERTTTVDIDFDPSALTLLGSLAETDEFLVVQTDNSSHRASFAAVQALIFDILSLPDVQIPANPFIAWQSIGGPMQRDTLQAAVSAAGAITAVQTVGSVGVPAWSSPIESATLSMRTFRVPVVSAETPLAWSEDLIEDEVNLAFDIGALTSAAQVADADELLFKSATDGKHYRATADKIPGVGTVVTGANLGLGAGTFIDVSVDTMRFRSFSGATAGGIGTAVNGNEIDFAIEMNNLNIGTPAAGPYIIVYDGVTNTTIRRQLFTTIANQINYIDGAVNLGSGRGVFADTLSRDLRFNSIAADPPIFTSLAGNTITSAIDLTALTQHNSPLAADLLMLQSSVDSLLYKVTAEEVANTATGFLTGLGLSGIGINPIAGVIGQITNLKAIAAVEPILIQDGSPLTYNFFIDNLTENFNPTPGVDFLYMKGSAQHYKVDVAEFMGGAGAVTTVDRDVRLDGLGVARLAIGPVTQGDIIDLTPAGVPANATAAIVRFVWTNPGTAAGGDFLGIKKNVSGDNQLVLWGPATGDTAQEAFGHIEIDNGTVYMDTNRNGQWTTTFIYVYGYTVPVNVSTRGIIASGAAGTRSNTSMSLTNGAFTPIPMLSVERDSDTYWDGGSGFIVPSDGSYVVATEGAFDGNSVDMQVFVYVNGSSVASVRTFGGTFTTRWRVPWTGVLSAGDKVELWCRQNSGSTHSLVDGRITIDRIHS